MSASLDSTLEILRLSSPLSLLEEGLLTHSCSIFWVFLVVLLLIAHPESAQVSLSSVRELSFLYTAYFLIARYLIPFIFLKAIATLTLTVGLVYHTSKKKGRTIPPGSAYDGTIELTELPWHCLQWHPLLTYRWIT